MTVDHADEYIYLGSPFSATGCITTDVKEHATLKQKHVNKFHIFCGKNQSMPFSYKKTVFEAVLTAKLLYGCESWFTENVKAIDKQYISAMKSLLGVRKQISNEVVLTELGAEDLRDRIHKSRKNFIKSKLSDPDEPLSIVYRLCERNNTKGYRMLQHALHSPCSATERRIQTIRDSSQTKL